MSFGVRLLRHTATVLGFLFLLVSLTPLTSWWARALATPWEAPSCEVLVALAGSSAGNGILGHSSYWRAVYTVRAWRERRYQEVVISGGGRQTAPPAEAMRDFLVASGVPAEIIRVETESTSTRENAIYTARMLSDRQGCITLLTSDFHMFRAYRLFRETGLDVRANPVPDAGKRATQWHSRWAAFLALCQETAKVVYYVGRGWI